MSKPKGSPKTGGRQKGTPNKRTQEFEDLLEREGFCPASALIRTYRRASKMFRVHEELVDAVLEAARNGDEISFDQIRGIASGDAKVQYLKIAGKAAADLLPYRFPKLKSMEITGKNGGPLDMFLRMTPEERARKRAELLARRKAAKGSGRNGA